MKYGPARARYERRKKRREFFKKHAWLWNTLSIIFAIGIFSLGGWYYWRITSIGGGGADIISTTTPSSPPEGERVKTSETDPISTEYPVDFDLPSVTSQVITITPTPEDESLFKFAIQSRPENISGCLFNLEHTCKWMGVAGQAFDLQGRPIPGITVQVSGPSSGNEMKYLSMTGSALAYGEAGYEVFLSDKPIDTMGEFEIRLVDQLGRGLSPRYTFNTCSDCEKNLVIINFKQIK